MRTGSASVSLATHHLALLEEKGRNENTYKQTDKLAHILQSKHRIKIFTRNKIPSALQVNLPQSALVVDISVVHTRKCTCHFFCLHFVINILRP